MGSSPIPATRPVGQAAKTPPFHGGNSSSILLRVTNKKTSEHSSDVFLSKPQAWHGITRQRAWNRRRRMASPQVYFSVDLIPCATSSQFHTAASRGFHTRLRRDLDADSAEPRVQVQILLRVTKKKSRVSGFFFLYSSLFSFHSSLFSISPARLFQIRDKREERKEKVAFLPLVEKHWFLVENVIY